MEGARVIIAERNVGVIGLGTAPLAFSDLSLTDAAATIQAALDAGVRLIDTALAYTRPGIESFAESTVAAALAGRRDVLVATKGGHRRVGDTFPVDARPAALRADCDRSLRALAVEAIDLYQLHHVDPEVDLVESVGALRELRDAGKIVLIGLSNVSIDQIEQALAVAPIAAVQNRLGFDRRADLTTARYCAERGIAYLAYMPLGGTGVRTEPSEAVASVAARHGVSPQRIQLAWLLAQDTPVIPLVGARRPASIVDSVAAGGLRLTADDLRRLDAA
jgi:aryl-alcohol dehydrogenase-like predicted oxidoreductase